MTSVEGVLSLCTVEGDRAKHHLMYSPTQSLWFEHFAQGYLKQMGQDVRKYWAITLRAMHGLMDVLEQEWADPIDEGHRELVASIEAYWVIAFCGSFCGPKVFTTGLHGLWKYLQKDKKKQGPLDHPSFGKAQRCIELSVPPGTTGCCDRLRH
jgi:hypothetical protein